MRARLLTFCLMQSCLLPVAEGPPDAAVRVSIDAGEPNGSWQAITCTGFDGGGTIDAWCNELPGNQRRCRDAELVGCSSLTQQLVIGEGYLAWTSFDYPNRVTHFWARKFDGGAPRELASSGEAYPMTIGAGFVWWGEVGSSATIRRVPLTGGAPETIATGMRNPRSMAANASSVFWSDDDGIWRVPTQGGPPTLLVPNTFQPRGLLLDANFLYWGEGNSGRIARVPLAGGAATTLFSGNNPWQLGLGGGSLYWSSDSAPAPISRGPSSGTGMVEIVAADQDVPRDMAVDDAGLYWVEQGGNFGRPVRIHSARLDGSGEASFLTPVQGMRLALDARYLYFGLENIYRLPR
jgi:hypothetical protein